MESHDGSGVGPRSAYNRSVKTLSSLLVAAGLVAATVAPSPAAPREVTKVEGITEYVLDNKMRVLLFPDASTENFTLNVTYLVGSRHEGYGETGMAHLLEHMLFKGSPKHPKVWEELKAKGASNNASTWYDRTNYFETLPNKGDNLEWALEMEADRMFNSNISQADLSKEFSVVRNEFEIGESQPAQVLSERMWSTAFLWHNYGKSTIGSRADIEKVPAAVLKKFYRKYYRPDNAVLVLSGKFDPQQALRLIDKHYGKLQNPREPLEPTYTQEPVQDGERVVTLRRSGDVQVVGLLYHVAATGDKDYAAVDAIGQLLTDEPSGRLYTALVKTGMATSVSAYQLTLHDPGVLEISATVPANKSIEAVRDKMIQIVEGLAKGKISDEEVTRFKAKSKKRFKLQFANSGSIATALSEFIGAGDWRLLFWNRDRVEALTSAEVQKVAEQYLMASNRTLGMFYPSKVAPRAPQKETPDVAKLVASYKGKPPETEGEKFEATLTNIEKRTQRHVLGNGMKVAMLPKSTRGKVVRARLTLRYGSEPDFTNQRLAASMLDEIISRGTKKRNFQQLKDQWDQLEAQVGFSTQPGVLDVSVQTTRDNLPAVLALVDEVLRQPSFPQDQFDIAIKESISALEEQKQDPQSQAFLNMSRTISPYPKNHPLYTPTTDELIAGLKALRLADVRKFAGYLGASNATMTVVGDFDPAATKGWVEKTWGTWKSPRPWKRLQRVYTPTKGGEVMLDFPDKANATVVVAHSLPVKDDDPDAPALNVANYTFGGGGFVSRLLTRLRQKDGLSYGAFSGVQLIALDAAGGFYAGGFLNPNNAKKGMAAMMEELTKLISQGITQAELDGAKTGIWLAFERNLSNDGAVLGMLAEGLYLDRKMDYWTQYYASMKALKLDQVNNVIKKHFKSDSLVKITAGDKKQMP
jgi:zinc protease